ncbi:MAG TPA: hypothetical protein VGX91_09510 [Candidatus Cybelea sp.]|jgi:hypothetical protein|nr:hypothetical protein [Candidatus Cybelea sp.]
MTKRDSAWRALGPLLFVSSLVLLLAAAPPSPVPSAAPPPSAVPAGIGNLPVVLIYPFEVQTGADPKLGIAIAQILAQEMVAAGGISVPAIPSGVKRADFLETARGAKADFYISGYVTPVGDSAAVVEQVVSVESGVILFSQTAQVSSVADVASQSLLARQQILAFLGHGTENVQPQASNTPAPTSTNGAKMPISGLGTIVDSVFKHKGGGATRAPSPEPTTKPSRGIIVSPVTAAGAVGPADLTNATHELYYAMDKRFITQMTTSAASPTTGADAICGSNRDNTIATGTLQVGPSGKKGTAVTFTLAVYTCFGAKLESEIGTASSLKAAVDAAVASYATAHPDNS